MYMSYFNMKDSLRYLLIRFSYYVIYLDNIVDNLYKVWGL